MLLATTGLEHMTLIADTCKPNPPKFWGAPRSLASLRLLHSLSCSIPPLEMPMILSCIPLVFGIRQESPPPPPIIVGAILDMTGAAEPAPVAL